MNEQIIVAKGGLVIPILAADPASPSNGALWYNSTENLFKRRENDETKTLGESEVAALEVSYDNTASGLAAENVQAAIDELKSEVDDAALAASGAQGAVGNHIAQATGAHASSAISYDNAASGLVATNVKTAIDELAAASGSAAAEDVSFDNSTETGDDRFAGSDVQAVISEAANMAQAANNAAGDAQDDIDDHISQATGAHASSAISYDNTISGLAAENVKTAIDELAAASGSAAAEDVSYDNTTSGLLAEDVQAAVDELASEQSTLGTDVADLVTLSGVPVNSDDLGSFNGTIISDDTSIKGALQDLEDYVLGLPDPIQYKGTWNAATNTPALANTDTDVSGYLYRVTTAGTVDFGAGDVTFDIGDSVVNNGTVWEKWDHSDEVISVNGQKGAVVLDTDDVSEGLTNLYFTEARVLATEVEESTSLSEKLEDIDLAIADRLTQVEDDSAPTLGGNLDMDGNVLLGDMKHGTAEEYYETQYVDAVTIIAEDTTVIATIPHAAFEGAEFSLKIKEATTGRVMIGNLYMATNGTDAVVSFSGSQTASLGITFDAAIVGANVEISAIKSTANNAVLRSVIKKIRA